MVAIMGDFNTRAGKKFTLTWELMGKLPARRMGKRLTDFVLCNDLKIMNNLFQHKDSHRQP
jgi:hypothetical protein